MVMTWILQKISNKENNSSIIIRESNPVNAIVVIKNPDNYCLHKVVKRYCNTSNIEVTAKRVAKYNNIDTKNLKQDQQIQIPKMILKRRVVRSFSK